MVQICFMRVTGLMGPFGHSDGGWVWAARGGNYKTLKRAKPKPFSLCFCFAASAPNKKRFHTATVLHP